MNAIYHHPHPSPYGADKRRRRRRQGCWCHCEWTTWFVLARFVAVIYVMFLVQQWTDSVERPNPGMCEIKDTFFMVIPNIPRMMNGGAHAADIWILIQLGVFFLWLFTTSPDPQLWVRRWFSMWTYGYGLRVLTVGATHFYPPDFKDQQPYVGDNVFLGALLLLVSVRSSLADLMFSGHTLTWVLSARFVYYYAVSPTFKALYVAGAILGPFLLIAVREHYSVDTIVAAIIATGIFSIYHLWYDKYFRQQWLRTWEVEVTQPMRIVYPVTLQNGDGTEWIIGADRAGEVELVGAGVTPERDAYMKLMRTIDGDTGPYH